ncbi:hypothetical protein QEZ40_007325 [Streptomyces katrae]|uniref:Uncharacterized protein n=1 Tax=Streptomyces katrae TaxID=68223 RepID=A0ABT7H6D1_9ACTN|nr:hypothetical protein [Streptomyces katrae]MDK9501118.1 hypothetical protein [Streptomyces katrae]
MTDQHAALKSPDGPLPGLEGIPAPSEGLLKRAHAGWERFLDTFEEVTDE